MVGYEIFLISCTAWIQFSFVAKSDFPIQGREPASSVGQVDTCGDSQILGRPSQRQNILKSH
jgi:hypothetical protein